VYSCLACEIGYFLRHNNCVSCESMPGFQNCSRCLYNEDDNSIRCIECKSSDLIYSDSDGTCAFCQTAILKCVQCDGTRCVRCSNIGDDEGMYSLSNGRCYDCSDIPNCEVCNGVSCVLCKNYFTLVSGGRCTECIIGINGCEDCDRVGGCNSCSKNGFFEVVKSDNKRKCVACNTFVETGSDFSLCDSCSNSNTEVDDDDENLDVRCDQCAQFYYMLNETRKSCVLCNITGCLECDW